MFPVKNGQQITQKQTTQPAFLLPRTRASTRVSAFFRTFPNITAPAQFPINDRSVRSSIVSPDSTGRRNDLDASREIPDKFLQIPPLDIDSPRRCSLTRSTSMCRATKYVGLVRHIDNISCNDNLALSFSTTNRCSMSK